MMRIVATTVVLGVLSVGCKAVPGNKFETVEDGTPSVTMSAGELAAEVRSSPARPVSKPFDKIGVMWDAASLENLQIATSADGVSFSEFKNVTIVASEQGVTNMGAGFLNVEDGLASFYKIQIANGAAPEFLQMEFLNKGEEEAAREERSVEGAMEVESAEGFNLASLLPGVNIVTRAAWKANKSTCTAKTGVKGVVLHHTAGVNKDKEAGESRMRMTQKYHQEVRGYCDLGYHFLVGQDGRIFEGRPMPFLGAHAGGANTNNIGISLMGNYEEAEPTQKQLDAVAKVMKGLKSKYAISLTRANFKGHREVGTTKTVCPGKNLFNKMDKLVQLSK